MGIEEQHIERFCKRLKEFRALRKLTQVDIASMLEMDDANYRRIESGRTKPSFATLIKLSVALKVEVSDFLLSDSELLMLNKLRELPPIMQAQVPDIDLTQKSKTVKHAEKITGGKLS